MCFVYLKCKLQQYSYGWCIFKLKFQETAEKWYLKAVKKVTCSQKAKKKVRIMFFEVKIQQDRSCWCNSKLNSKNQPK